MDYKALIDAVLEDVHAQRGQGNVASYIPALARADPEKFGIALALEDGSTYVAGDADEAFSIQSISYVFSLAIALHYLKASLWNHVGREPGGLPLTSVYQLELEKGRPRNPLMSAGAMVVCDRLIRSRGGGAEGPLEELLAFLSEGAGEAIAIDEDLAMSESRAGEFNRSIAHLISALGNLESPVEDVLSLYDRQCSIAMSCRQLARAARFLAFDGHDPQSGRAVTTQSRVRRINALMMTSGHYDSSGEFAFRVGLPAKSSVSGAILAVVPEVGTVCVWSPGLNASGISLVGALALERLAERADWSVFS